jgi:outer membrane protein assembly factor BamA
VPAIDEQFSTIPSDAPIQWAPGLFSVSRILSYGTYLLFDTRDNTYGLTRGVQVFGRLASYDGLNNNGAFEDYGWTEAEVDVRAYIPIFSPITSLALRSRGELKTTKGGSQIPFYDLAWLGGREYVRGYETYRFRGQDVLMFSAELRRTVRELSVTRGIDVFAFADTGQVWGDSRSASDPLVLQNRKFNASNWHSGVGGGIQYRHSSRVAGRLEIGHSNEGNVVYASLTRGF